MQVCWVHKFSNPLNKHLGAWLLDYIRLCLACKTLTNVLQKWLYHFSFPPAMNENFCWSESLLAVGTVSLLDFSQSSSFVVVSHCFDLQFLSDKRCEHVFICLFSIRISSLVRCLVRFFANLHAFLFLLLCVLRVFVYFGLKSFIRYAFWKYFFSACGLCFQSFISVFHGVEVFNCTKTNLSFFFLSWIMLLILYLRTHHQTYGYIDFLPCFLLVL